MSKKPFTVGLAGLGTVGIGVVKILEENHSLIEEKVGRSIEIRAISARDKSKHRGQNLQDFEWVNDTISLGDKDGLDAIIEVIGGCGNPSKA
jgi:Homoserine dehydrogenase